MESEPELIIEWNIQLPSAGVDLSIERPISNNMWLSVRRIGSSEDRLFGMARSAARGDLCEEGRGVVRVSLVAFRIQVLR